MLLSERVAYGLAGGFAGAAIAMAMMFWTSFEHTDLLFSVLIPAGAVGGFLIGKAFYNFLIDLFHKIW